MKTLTLAAAAAISLIALSASAQAAGPGAAAHGASAQLQLNDGASGIHSVGFRSFQGHRRFGFLRHITMQDKCGFYLKKFKKTGRPFWFAKYEDCKEDYYDNYGH